MKRIKILSVQPLFVSHDVVTKAAGLAFASPEIVQFASLKDAQMTPTEGASELLVIDSGSPHLFDAAQTYKVTGEHRWSVVALGADSLRLAEDIPPVPLTVPILAWVFRDALDRQQLRCENSRLRGDLKTVARRISHDLRSPLGCIHTSVDVLMELSANDSETRLGMTESIRQSSGEISQIVDRVRFLLLASSDPVPMTKVDMGGIVEGVVRQLENPMSSSATILLLPDTWPEVRGVSSWLAVVWSNLLVNSIQHSGSNPKIQIEWIALPGGFRFTVTDCGPGVLPARVGGLFSRFDRLHELRATGLGLSIVQRLVELQGGICGHLKPAVGGASFYFTLSAAL